MASRILSTNQRWLLILSLPCLLGLAAPAHAQAVPEGESGPEFPQGPGSGKTLRFLPRGDLYKPYIADPHRVSFGAFVIGVPDSGIDGAGDTRIGLRAGGRFGIFRLHPNDDPELGWQISFEAGFDTQFDVENSQDNIGWDGNFGWYLTAATPGGWSYKLASLHTSSHIGDEYIENTGRARINYTRREIALGLSKLLNPVFRTYAEVGVGYDPGNENLQEPVRLQGGLEFERPNIVWRNIFGWYAALDVTSMQERDWRADVALQTGLSIPTRKRMHRIGIEVYKGRPPLGEFFQDTELTVTLGIWVDL